MELGIAVIILGEVGLFLFLVYGFLHEDRFMAFEDRAFAAIKQRRNAKAAVRRRKINKKVRYTPERPVRGASSGNRVA